MQKILFQCYNSLYRRFDELHTTEILLNSCLVVHYLLAHMHAISCGTMWGARYHLHCHR